VINNSAITLAASGNPKDIRLAIDMMGTEITILNSYSVQDRVNFIYKLEATLYILRAWWQSCLGEFEDMEASVKEAYRLATAFDEEEKPEDLMRSIKYTVFSKKKISSFDTLGVSAREGIEQLFLRKPDSETEKNYVHMKKVIDSWNSLKEQ